MAHPLTDKICYQISEKNMESYGDTRAALRDAADWQLEQVVTWLSEQGYYYVEAESEGDFLVERLTKAMRPQEDNL